MRFRHLGRQVSISTHIYSLHDARLAAPDLILAWLKQHGQEGNTQGGSGESLATAIGQFLELEYQHARPGTIESVKRTLRRLQEALKVDRISDITRERFEASVPGLRGESSPKHWSNILGILRKFFRWAVKRDLLLRDPTVGVPLPPSSQFGRRGPESVWTEEELEKVLSRLGEADREMVMVLRHTGMDVADLFELRRQHLVKDQDGNLKIVKRREKGHTDRETMNQPVSSKVLDILMRQHKATAQPDDRIFPTKYKNFTSAGSALYDRVRRAWDSLGVKSKDLKSLRHSFATYHVRRNVPITQLRKWMGHAPDSRMLESVYDHVASSAEYMD